MTENHEEPTRVETWIGEVVHVDDEAAISTSIKPMQVESGIHRGIEHDFEVTDLPEHIRRKLGLYSEFLCSVKLTANGEYVLGVSDVEPKKPKKITQEDIEEAMEEFEFLTKSDKTE